MDLSVVVSLFETQQGHKTIKRWPFVVLRIYRCSINAASKATKILSTFSPTDSFIKNVTYMALLILYLATLLWYYKTATYMLVILRTR